MKPLLNISANANTAAAACADRVNALIEDAVQARGLASLAVSGGHTPGLLFDNLAKRAIDWSRVHLFWVDERGVPPEDDASNYKLAKEHLIGAVNIPEGNVHRVLGELDPREAAVQYVEEIRAFFGLGAEGDVPAFDILQCGMGPDAHTASLFPGQPLIDDRKGIAAAVYAPQFAQWRITLLPKALQAAKHIVYLVSGSDKAQALKAVLEGPLDPKKYPTQLIGRSAEWFLDEAAAQLIQQ